MLLIYINCIVMSCTFIYLFIFNWYSRRWGTCILSPYLQSRSRKQVARRWKFDGLGYRFLLGLGLVKTSITLHLNLLSFHCSEVLKNSTLWQARDIIMTLEYINILTSSPWLLCYNRKCYLVGLNHLWNTKKQRCFSTCLAS